MAWSLKLEGGYPQLFLAGIVPNIHFSGFDCGSVLSLWDPLEATPGVGVQAHHLGVQTAIP